MSKSARQKNRTKLQDFTLYNEFREESDRGLAMLCGAALDILLRDLLANFLINDSAEVDILLGSEDSPDTPLGAFATRIRAAYCLGLLTKEQRDNLSLIRRIRNHFAHQLHGSKFSEEPVQSWCNALRLDDDMGQPESDRMQFAYAYVSLSIEFKSMAEVIVEQRREVPTEYIT